MVVLYYGNICSLNINGKAPLRRKDFSLFLDLDALLPDRAAEHKTTIINQTLKSFSGSKMCKTQTIIHYIFCQHFPGSDTRIPHPASSIPHPASSILHPAS